MEIVISFIFDLDTVLVSETPLLGVDFETVTDSSINCSPASSTNSFIDVDRKAF